MTVFRDPQSPAYARLTGALYLIIAVAGGFSIAFVPSQLVVAGDAAATFDNILGRRTLFHLGIAGDVVMMVAEVMVTAMLFYMFARVNRTLSLVAALARFAMVTVMAAMLLFHVAALELAVPDSLLTSFTPPQRTDLAGLMLAVHDAGVWVWQIFFTVHLVVLGTLVVHSGSYPPLLGRALSVGGLGYLLDSIHAFAAPDATWLEHLRTGLLVVVTLAEVGFAFWLLIRGPRPTLAGQPTFAGRPTHEGASTPSETSG